MKLIMIYDFETSGLPIYEIPSEDPSQPHTVQVGAILVDADTHEVKEEINVIVKPDGWIIPDDVAAIHGITTEQALAEGIPEKQVTEQFLEMWRKCQLRVAHNENFDARIARIMLKRFFDDVVAEEFKAGERACTGLLAKPVMQMLPKNKYGYKMPKLIEAYQHFMGKPLEGAHNAMNDARACMEIFWKLQELQKAGAA